MYLSVLKCTVVLKITCQFYLFIVSDKDCAFQINHREKSFHVFASSENDKDNWVRNLTTYLSKMKDEKGLFQYLST